MANVRSLRRSVCSLRVRNGVVCNWLRNCVFVITGFTARDEDGFIFIPNRLNIDRNMRVLRILGSRC